MFRFVCAALLAASVATPSALSADRVSLRDAFSRALGSDPAVPAADARRDAAEANIRQSGAGPNPSLSLSVENFGGTGATRGLNEVETTLSYEQPIELGGKRAARIGLAERQRDAASIKATLARLNLIEAVQRAYFEALAAEAEVGLAEERLKSARELNGELQRRIDSARDPEFAGARAKSQLADAQLGLEQARLAARAGRALLASYWGGGPEIRLDAKMLEDLRLTPANPAMDGATPDERFLEAERAAAAANVDLERSNAVRDPTFNVGVRHFGANDDVALMIGGSIPLSLFDDNSGAIARAGAEQRAADLDLAAYRRERVREIQRLNASLAISASEVRQIDEAIIPAAARAVRQASEGFSRGAFGYLDLFEAQNALSEARARRIAALRRFHDVKARLDRLLGVHASVANPEVFK